MAKSITKKELGEAMAEALHHPGGFVGYMMETVREARAAGLTDMQIADQLASGSQSLTREKVLELMKKIEAKEKKC